MRSSRNYTTINRKEISPSEQMICIITSGDKAAPMNIIKYPVETDVNKAIAEKEPLLVLISFDGETAIISHIDEAVEHHILLAKAGFPSTDIDKYFRIVLDEDGADWTFVCPPDYKGIADKQRRITAFYKDGFSTISEALSELGFMVGINIPKRYRRHFDYMMNE